MIQFGMRVHDICPKGSVCEVLDEVQKLHIHYIHLAMNKSFSDVDTSVGHFSAGLGDYVASELRKRDLHVSILGCYINPAHPDEEKRLQQVQRFIEHMKYAKLIGADMVLGLVNKDKAKTMKQMRTIMQKFHDRNHATQCRQLKGVDTHVVLRPCPLCVADACEFLEDELKK